MAEQQIPLWANATVASLLQILRSKEPGTFEHSLRVGESSKQLAMKLGLNLYQQKVTEVAALLHDLGESTIDQDIIAKPTKLNAIEYEIMKSHVAASEEFVRPLAAIHPFFNDVLKAIRSHHEQDNGMGYPDKLQRDQIPIISQIISLVDAYDAMTTARVYKSALTPEKAYAEIQKSAGIQFGRQIVTIFLISHRSFKVSSTIDLENQLYKLAA